MKEQFILSARTVFYDNGQIGLVLFPQNSYLSDKIEVQEMLNIELDLDNQINDLKTLFTPIVFGKIQEMENIPNAIKESIQL